MKLYIYEHCPFCARVRYVARSLELAIDLITVDYDDNATTTKMIDNKQVPMLVKGNGEAMAESLDIIEYLLNLADSTESGKPSQDILDWQNDAFLPLQKIGYPRWYALPLKEFATASSKSAWRKKKETAALNFDALLADTPNTAKDVEALINKARKLLKLGETERRSLVDEAIVFSILRGFFSAEEIVWDADVKNWMASKSKTTGVSLLNQPLSGFSQTAKNDSNIKAIA